jgi:hypothetical protein
MIFCWFLYNIFSLAFKAADAIRGKHSRLSREAAGKRRRKHAAKGWTTKDNKLAVRL